MKYQHQNQGGLNFDILGIGKPGEPVAKQPEPKRDEVDTDAGMSFLLNLFNSESGRPAETMAVSATQQPEPEEDQWWLDKVPEEATQQAATQVTKQTHEPMAEVDPENLDVETIVTGVKAFVRSVVDNLEASAATLKFSTGELFNAGLGVAMNLSLLNVMGITRDAEGSYQLPTEEKICELEATYEIFLTIGNQGYTDMDQFLVDHGEEITGIDPSWENILNGLIATRTNLTADDSIGITSILAETWCGELEEDEEIELNDSLEALLGHIGHDHSGDDDCDDEDDEEDDIEGRISVIMESSDDDDVDIMTITGIDNRSVTFFIEDYAQLVHRAKAGHPGKNGRWEWLGDMLPAFTVRTSKPDVILAMNDRIDHDIRFVKLLEDSGDAIIGVYLLEEGLFDPDDADSLEVIDVINELFRAYLTPALSQRRRIAMRFESLMESEENLFKMLAEGGVDIDQFLREEPVAEVLEATDDDTVTEPEAHEVNDDHGNLNDIGREVAEMFVTSSDRPKSEDEPVVDETEQETGDSGLIFKPITKKKHRS